MSEKQEGVRYRRPWTDDALNDHGKRRITVKRACNGCKNLIGDVTVDEMERAICGLPRLDVRDECPFCTPVEPAAEAERSTSRVSHGFVVQVFIDENEVTELTKDNMAVDIVRALESQKYSAAAVVRDVELTNPDPRQQQALIAVGCGDCNSDGVGSTPGDDGWCEECRGSGLDWDSTTVEALTERKVKEAVEAERERIIDLARGHRHQATLWHPDFREGARMALDDLIKEMEPAKPTAEDVLAAHWDVYDSPKHDQPSGCTCGKVFKVGERIAMHRVELLREAGLLKEVE